MRLSPSAHLDTFCRDRLPPPEQWPEFRFDLPELSYPERLNCAAELLDATAARHGAERPCLHSIAGTWTYGETVRRTNQLAQVLTEDFGLRPGQRVLLRGPNNPWLAAAWLAVIKAGAVAVTTMALLRPREIATIVGLTQPSLALCDHRFAADLAAGAPALTAIHYGGNGPDDLAARCAAKDGVFQPADILDALLRHRERERVRAADRRGRVLAPVDRRPAERGRDAADVLRVEDVHRAAVRADRAGQRVDVGLGGGGDDRAGVPEDHVGQERRLIGAGRRHHEQCSGTRSPWRWWARPRKTECSRGSRIRYRSGRE